ncbi:MULTISPECIES: glycine betaine ABC transporter substrate-binding protein [Rhizobium]|uniref:Glycine betaine/proline transport system substrate-binding protein n=1 Tax=Rhizobium paranaense TaxID=1650438 RepID=A0A7W9D0B8_9HYPH|nr:MULTISPECIES: glycine betaine ABC transporter substrate-binding protein [Rhizobium]MBB5573094.1 glycine betaine/proline transport system substrate-binding protein [Rhizobium paranaense]PST62136.1 amino acid-binding protein [Rhizobium sp. SEMIA4064]
MKNSLISASVAFAAALASVGTVSADAADLVIAMPNWPSGQAAANILKVAIAKEYRLDAEVRELGTLTAFNGLESGEVDINPEVWRPNLDSLIEKYVNEKHVVEVAARGVDAWEGLCATPDAVAAGIKDIADLSDPAKTALLDTDGDGRGELWIGAATWLSTGIERVRANSYGYAKNLTLVEAEEEVGMAAVDAAVATGRPMVFACYAPHHVFELHKIVRLTEPPYDVSKWKIMPASDPTWISDSSAPVAWPATSFHIAYAAAFAKKHTDVASFLEKVDFTPEEITHMTYALQVERQLPLEFAKQWVDSHASRVDGWAKP